MELKDILCVVDHSAEAENAFRYAANLARFHEANLIVLCAVPDLPASLYMATQFNREWLDIFVSQYESEAGRLFHHFSTIAKKHAINFEWVTEQGDPQTIIERHSRLVDLVITAKQHDESGLIGTNASIATHVLELTTPSIVLPANRTTLPPPKNILVAWDGGKQAAKALKAAVPLLRHADAVRLIQVASQDAVKNRDAISAKSAIQFLARKKIEASYSEIEPAAGMSDVDTLFNSVTNDYCNLLVMGAYGHSRFSEMVLGGMTKDVLQKLHLPVFMVH